MKIKYRIDDNTFHLHLSKQTSWKIASSLLYLYLNLQNSKRFNTWTIWRVQLFEIGSKEQKANNFSDFFFQIVKSDQNKS